MVGRLAYHAPAPVRCRRAGSAHEPERKAAPTTTAGGPRTRRARDLDAQRPAGPGAPRDRQRALVRRAAGRDRARPGHVPCRAGLPAAAAQGRAGRAAPPPAALRRPERRRRRRVSPASSPRPGPIYDPEGARTDYWRFARALYAAGFRPGDIVHNSFSYHLTPPARWWRAGRGRWPARWCRAGQRRSSCSCAPSPTSARPPTPARPRSCSRSSSAAASSGSTRARSAARSCPARPCRRRRASVWPPSSASARTSATPRPTSASSPTRRGRARGWWSTRR